MATQDNLKEAFAGESQANRMYLAFAKKAEQDGFPGVARLFRATAEAETVHAHAHFRAMGSVKDTAANLDTAAEGEGYEFQKMYPGFLEEAEAEGASRAVITSFKYAMAAEEVHHGLYRKAVEMVKDGKDLDGAAIFLCPICGNIEIGTVPDTCPICGAPKAKFIEVA